MGKTEKHIILEEIYDSIDKVKGHIYKITCKKSNKIYIGQTYSHIKNHGKYRPAGYLKRFASHISEAIKNTKTKQCTYLNNAIRKYGKDEFSCELITTCELDELDTLEKDYIKKYNSLYPKGYNLTEGGKGAIYISIIDRNKTSEQLSEPYKHSDETKAKIKQRLKNILASDSKRQERRDKCRVQHMKARLKKYHGILLDNDITKYIYPIIKKNTNQVYKYDVRINGIITTFWDDKTSVEQLYNNALTFLNELKIQNGIVV